MTLNTAMSAAVMVMIITRTRTAIWCVLATPVRSVRGKKVLTMPDTLKPCPFCGGKMSLIYRSSNNEFHVFHANGQDAVKCPILEPFVIDALETMSLAEARKAWNCRRVGEGEKDG